MSKLQGRRVLVTGGAGGIGQWLAGELGRAGNEVIITDVNVEALEQTAAKLRASGVVVHTRAVDVTDRAAVEELARWVETELGGLDVLVNNAGIGHTGEIADTSLETWHRLMNVNFWGPLHHVYAFLPAMIRRRAGHIVNVSSGQAFFQLPTWGPYAAIKLALGGFSEILRFELRKHGIAVTTVYPFMVDTGFYGDIKGETWGQKVSMKLVPYYSMKPEKVAHIIFKAIERRKGVEMVSPLNDVAKQLRSIPGATSAVSTLSMLFLGKDKAQTHS
jgi:NAD(P)-dependent dehydrogenase (short-subunit alcohol dehydrogenase family)